jgi:hypothetical protein
VHRGGPSGYGVTYMAETSAYPFKTVKHRESLEIFPHHRHTVCLANHRGDKTPKPSLDSPRAAS